MNVTILNAFELIYDCILQAFNDSAAKWTIDIQIEI